MITGRPNDSKIQKLFMQKLRGTKLQVINAQSELQMCLAKKQKDLGTKNTLTQDKIAYIFSGSTQSHTIQHQKMGKLNKLFNQGLEKWQFSDIKQTDPFPKYLFDDGSDLSYILDYIRQNSQIKTFESQELLYLHLLCLLNRKQLTDALLEYYQTNLKLIIKYINVGKKKINIKLQSKQKLIKTQSKLQDDQEDEEQQSQEGKVLKTKPIKKQPKKKGSKKQKKKGKDSESQKEQNSDNNEEQNQIDPNKELAIKSVNYITWAYFYILKG